MTIAVAQNNLDYDIAVGQLTMSATLPNSYTTVPIVVTGFGRCGTSMVMQMLSAGGIPCIGSAPVFENYGAVDFAFWEEYRGHAVKVLDIHRNRLPGSAKIILLVRDHGAQVASMINFAKTIGLRKRTDRAAQRELKRNLDAGLPLIKQAAAKAGNTLLLRFEDVLSNPCLAATQIGRFLAFDAFDERKAANAVLPRSARVHGLTWEMHTHGLLA